MLASLALAMSGATCCQPNIDSFVSDEHQYVLLGELHGTNELPRYFELTVRRALLARGNVVAAMELPEALNGPLNSLVASEMLEQDKTRFLDALRIHASSDGRTSQAVIDVIFSLAKLAKENPGFSLRFVVPTLTMGEAGSYSTRLADNIVEASDGGLVIALMGNIHASSASLFSSSGEPPAGGILPEESTLNVLLRTAGGDAWNCLESAPCGVVSNPIEELDCGAREVEDSLSTWFDISVDLDILTSASRPYFYESTGPDQSLAE
jgi:hypothetical protein